MASDPTSIFGLLNSTMSRLTNSPSTWADFLQVAGRLYKYAFPDQVLIYAQRPDATACADYVVWNNTMHRFIRRGAKGIALLDDSGDKLKLHYVFDVSDTSGGEKSRRPFVWKYLLLHEGIVAAALEQEYAVLSNVGLTGQLEQIAKQIADEYWQDHQYDILHTVDDSLLEEYDEFNIGLQFRNVTTVSIAYALMSRCGLDPADYFEHEDFRGIVDFNTPSTVTALGAAVSEGSQRVLRQIEVTIKKYEREHLAERSVTHGKQSDIHEERGLPDTRPDHHGAAREVGQVRENAEELPKGEPTGALQQPSDERGTAPASSGDRPDSDGSHGANDAPADGHSRSDRKPESLRSDALGRPDEQSQGAGRGDYFEGTHIQLSLFPSEEEQIQLIEEAESNVLPAFSISQDEIDAELRHSGNKRILDFYLTNPSAKDAIHFLKEEYGWRGNSHTFLDGTSGMVDYRPNPGLTMQKYGLDSTIIVKWNDIDKRLRVLITDENYLNAEDVWSLDNSEVLDGIAPYQVGESVTLDYGGRELSGTVGNIRDTDVRIDTGPYSWSSEVINREHFEKGIQQYEQSAGHITQEQAKALFNSEKLPQLLQDDGELKCSKDDIVTFFENHPDAALRGFFLKNCYKDVFHSVYWVGAQGHYIGYHANELGLEVWDGSYITASLRFTIPWEEAAGYVAMLIEENSYLSVNYKLKTATQAHESITGILELEPPPAVNYKISDDKLGEGGAKSKYAFNIAAIKALREIEAEGRAATPDEQDILSRYVGWGGLAEAFDDSKPTWAKECKELRAVLSSEEYVAARASTLNAHYTSPTVIRGIYKAVSRLGFRAGNILEPSCGVGNFFGCLPDELRDSRLYGVELDSITGRIAKQLYPQADITVAGFETTDKRDFFDLAVGNVPFGQYQVNDRAYNKLGFSIHDYFFAKTLDQVRPGGVVAFVTSRYTMDKQSPEVRRYIAQRAELLGAIRLPNDAFKANAGTEVVSDIIFLQKRDRPIVTDPDWVHLGQTQDDFTINSYFIEHPEMVLGTPASENTQYGRQDYTVIPIPSADLADQLNEAVSHISGQYTESELPELSEGEKIDDSIPADPSVKNYSYTVLNGEVYYRENSRMVRPYLNDTAKGRIKGMVELRDCVRQLIDLQMDEYAGDTAIHESRVELNSLYDAFSAQYGLINSRGNKLAFSDDSAYYLLCSLEVLDDDGNFERKADMFTKRTIRQQRSVTSVDTAAEALAVSIGERAKVDLPFMARLSGLPEEQIKSDLKGVIFKDPSYGSDPNEGWQAADEYLSGNVRKKLRIARRAAERDSAFQFNVEALEKAQPKDLDASEIEVRLGATWIDKAYIQQFMEETFNTPNFLLGTIQVKYTAYTAEWQITNKSRISYNDVAANTTYGTDRASAYRILEDSLNLRDIRIYDTIEDPEGKERRVLNYKQTTLAEQKQQVIREAFRDWIWRDPERRQTLVSQYNEEMNSTRPREYDGRHITFSGMNPEIVLREHQLNAIAHILYGGNTLLAHEVGAGKTFEMVAACMESKRLGLSHKSIFVVPNHLTEQWASEFLRLYPSANLLVTTKKDFETHNRKRFCARITTGDYDAVIIGHSQFERIPISPERQERLLQEQIWEITEGISEVEDSGGERFTVKQLERTKKGLEVRLEKLQASDRKDDVVTFEQLGVDRMFVDESHNYKNLFLYTKMRNVAGLATTDAQKSSDMFAKCRYMDELTKNRGVIFATGTPISNSMTELYTIQRYLQYDRLKELDMTHFDCWASRFGETTTAIELAPEGTGYRARTRFAKFFNLPELMNLFREVADIKTADQLDLPVPEAMFHTVVAQPTEHQKEMVQALSKRASLVHSGVIDPSIDNMLKITSDGRKLGLDQRIINSMLPDEPQSKVNHCVDNVFHIWDEGQPEKLTQLVFCDISTPKAGTAKAAKAGEKTIGGVELHALEHMTETLDIPNEPEFTVYADIRQKLISRGVPAEQVAFIHDANTDVRKKELFAKVRSGQVRVLLGSTFKMGAGTNVQDRLGALHDLDCPWRPGDLEQRKGRIVRQGNKNKTVDIYRYVTEGTFDSYLYQTIETKQKFISQIMSSKSPVRSCEDIDETALSYAEIKALCAGNPLIKERMDLEIEVSRLRLMRADHQSKQFRLEDSLIKYFPEQIEQSKGVIRGLQADITALEAHPHPKDDFAGMEVCGDHFTSKENAGVALLDACKGVTGRDPVQIGSYHGFAMQAAFDPFDQSYTLTLKGSVSHRVELGKDARGNLTRIDNALSLMPDHLKSMRSQLDNLYAQVEAAKLEVGKPFPQETEFQQKTARLAELNIELNMELAEGKSTLADDAGPIPDVYSDQAAEEEWEEEL